MGTRRRISEFMSSVAAATSCGSARRRSKTWLSTSQNSRWRRFISAGEGAAAMVYPPFQVPGGSTGGKYADETPQATVIKARNSNSLLNRQNSLISRFNSLIPRFNSLLEFKKFPVRLRREFACKPLNLLLDWGAKIAQKGKNLQISLLISLLAGNLPRRLVRG